jgi:hypothetical protein
LAQLAVHEGREVYAFTKPGDAAGQEFARSLGVAWAGSSEDLPPQTPRRCYSLRAGRGFDTYRPESHRAGWNRRVRRDSHERHTRLSLRHTMGGTGAALGSQSHAEGRRGVPSGSFRV